ncbi:rod shape-determining protein MreC [Nocardioides baculatus]|uniref:Cell shape-determining protein MreC n=1 Tax=Nocardioides baculatus TaxID=2801337 RepID=A0ABS1L6E4_9ACTN|nr:rod shape-determining protein MreC [Nocardioides baculatus]MBL0747185.1 rod shape-determining protein MreC [Nocardioides baculatus]
MASLGGRERRWTGLDRLESRNRPPRSLLVALVLASITLVTLDVSGGASSPLEPARRAVGEAFGPAESAVATAVRPFTSVPAWFRSKGDLADEVRDLEASNADLKSQVELAGFERNRLEQYDGLTAAATDLGSALVPARVVAVGSRQSQSFTVTIDAGSAAGVGPDMTVVNNDGLVGRVLRVSRSTATVLLIVDPDSTVGGRVGSSMEIGFVNGSGSLDQAAGLDLRLVDDASVPARDDTVVTWGSASGPYEPGVPIGRITEVYSSLREASQRAVVEPFVDFSSLDVVGVMVPSGSQSDRALVEADGTLR